MGRNIAECSYSATIPHKNAMVYAFSFLFLLFAYIQYRQYRALEHFKKHGQIAVANITSKEIKEGKWGINKCYLNFTYPDNQGKFYKGQSMVSPAFFYTAKESHAIDILFLNENPQKSILSVVHSERMSTVIALLLLSLISAAIIPLIF